MKSAEKNLAPLIQDVVSIRSRYVRAVNIGRDLGDPQALEGYLLTDTVRQALTRLCDGLLATSSQRAWRITGSYGGGKSALGLFVASLFEQPLIKRSPVGMILGQDAPELLAKARKLPRYETLILTGNRSDASVALASALRELLAKRRASSTQKQLLTRLDTFIAARQRRETPPHEAIDLLQASRAYLASGGNPVEGLLLIVDELGRWLEYAVDPTTDMDASFFQALAEACGGRAKGIPLAMIGILHQRFEDYIESRRDRRSGLEWTKVAERFEEITFSQSFESTCQLVARAFEVDVRACQRAGVAAYARSVFKEAAALGVLPTNVADRAAGGLGLYPFHPTALVAATTLFRRFGQNERSTFSFLLSSEPFAFQDFIARHRLSPGAWYRVPDLCDWLLAQGALRTQENERLRRWALLQDVLRTAPVFDELEVLCLKTVGLLNLLEPQPGLVVRTENVAYALEDASDSKRVHAALARLVEKRLLYFRPATREWCLWPQSSVDVATELARIRQASPPLTRLGSLIEHLPSARPLVAHRHYVDRGTLRTAQVLLVDDLAAVPAMLAKACAGDGQILIVPCYPDQSVGEIAPQVERLSALSGAGTLLGLRCISENELTIAEELLAWKQLESECKELRVDEHARNEVKRAIHRLTTTMVHQLADLRVPSQGGQGMQWWHQGRMLPVTDGRSLNRSLSEIFDALYGQTPVVRNELINRSAISSAAAAARMRLMERMASHGSVEDLGIELTPPEKAIYLSVLKESGLHRPVGEGDWAFAAPTQGSSWEPTWNALLTMLDQQGLVSVRRVVDYFAAAPFGMRESLTLLLVGAFLQVHRRDLILRERGTYITQVEAAHLARLVKRPEAFELHMVNTMSSMQALLDVYREVVNDKALPSDNDNTISAITRTLYRWYLALPEHTLSTAQLDARHRAALALMGKAGDPVELLTVGLPLALGVSKEVAPFHVRSELDLQRLRSALRGFLQSVSERMNVLRRDILKVMAEECGVRDTAAVRPHLVALAEKIDSDVVDYALRAFMQRTCDGKRDQEQWIDSLASLLGGRTLETWLDDSLVRFRGELRRVFTLLTRVVALAKLTHRNPGPDHAVVAVHVVDQKGHERFVTVSADAIGVTADDRLDALRAMLDQFPVPAYVLARLLLDYAVELPEAAAENAR